MNKYFFAVITTVFSTFLLLHAAPSGKDKVMAEEIFYPCKIDNSLQPAIFVKASGNEPRPLVVGLHTWSCDYRKAFEKYVEYAKKHNWNFIFPNFRGPNWTKEACGSDYVVSDIEDAVTFAKNNAPVDDTRIYLVGGSGGGHGALLMAGKRPDLWAAVSAWCPPADLIRWHQETRERKLKYYKHINKVCGGDPNTSAAAKNEAVRRSSNTYLPNVQNQCIIDINHGVRDWSVPVSQGIRAFNILAAPQDRIPEEDIEFITRNRLVPEHLKTNDKEPSFGKHTVYLRRISGNTRLTLFDGKHVQFRFSSLEWLGKQQRGKKPDWSAGSAEASPDNNSELTK